MQQPAFCSLSDLLNRCDVFSEPLLGNLCSRSICRHLFQCCLNFITQPGITFFEANRSSLFIHTTQKSYACRDTLKNLQTRLRRFPFERIHKSFIVNTKFISCLQSDSLILQDGTVLPVSKHKMAPMRHYLKLLMESSLL